MKAARIVVLAVAVGAGGLAALLAGRQQKVAAPPQPVAQLATTDVLVASKDIEIGQAVSVGDLRWQTWPAAAASSYFIRKSDRPKAIADLTGSIARAPLATGEPIRESKLVKANGSGFMAAILPPGMRAVSTVISPETGAGGFILPNDHVDVILSRRDTAADKSSGGNSYVSETVLHNIRVLAIDQTVQEKNGQKVVVGKTATLELSPHQAETLTLARQLGSLSLALRSLVDDSKALDAEDKSERSTSINTVRFGVTTTMIPK